MSYFTRRSFVKIGSLSTFGVLGLLFFLVKGLLWLLVPALIAIFANS